MTKRFSLLLALLAALALGGTSTLYAQEMWEEDDLAAFESDNWMEDDYGYYDEDFDWEAGDEEFTSWYEDDDDWGSYYEEDDEWFDFF